MAKRSSDIVSYAEKKKKKKTIILLMSTLWFSCFCAENIFFFFVEMVKLLKINFTNSKIFYKIKICFKLIIFFMLLKDYIINHLNYF